MNAMTLFGIPGAMIVVSGVLAAACWDLLYRRIPNRLTVLLLALWCATAIWTCLRQGVAEFTPQSMAFGAGCAAIVLLIGFVLFSMQAVGAGDVKLAAVVCLWLGKGAVTFLLATSLAGGVLILHLPLVRRLETILAVSLMRLPRHAGKPPITTPVILSGESPQGLPYGPAIAAGALFTILHTWA